MADQHILADISQKLHDSLDPRTKDSAEAALLQNQTNPGYSLNLLSIVANPSVDYSVRLAGAIFFKNLILRNWTDEDGNYKLIESDVVVIKRELINLMITCPPQIQTQLGGAISAIANSDFWERWDTLVDDLVSKLSPNDFTTNIGVLQVAHSIFERWRPLVQSNELYVEINHVLERFGLPYMKLFESLDDFISKNGQNREQITLAFKQLDLMIKLFYDLSCHDLPPIFENNLATFATLLNKYLTYDNELLHTDEYEIGLLEYVKSDIFEILKLYVQKYGEDFESHVANFIEKSWTLLTTLGAETKYDVLISRALQFLTSVAANPTYVGYFQSESILGEVTKKVLVPSVTLRESDIEMFEDEPIEFIRRDLEGSDSDTKRRAATDFLRQLLLAFEGPVTDVVYNYIKHYLDDYSRDTKENWKSKDTAVYLYSAIAAKGTTTASHGVTTTNSLLDITSFLDQNLASDLVSQDPIHPILKVDAIKYLYTFRSQITKEQWQVALPLLTNHLNSPEYPVYTYAAVALERSLYLTDAQSQPVIPPEAVVPLAGTLLERLLQLIEKDPSPPKLQENEFLMRCVMRVLIVIKGAAVPLIDSLMPHFIGITEIISTNPSNPRFYYFHFEAIGALIRNSTSSDTAKLEQNLYQPFVDVLQKDVQEFVPYVLQLLAALLEADASAPLPQQYQIFIAPVLAPPMWETKGNVPALIRFLSAVIPRATQIIMENKQMDPILGIFQKLVSSKANENHAFDLLETVIAHYPLSVLSQYLPILFSIILTKLSRSGSESYASRFVRFYHFFCAHDEGGYSADVFCQVVEGLEAGSFTAIYLTYILPGSPKLARPVQRKTAIVALTKTLCNSEAFANRYKKGWGYTCETLLALLALPPVVSAKEDLPIDAEMDDMAFGVGFTPLNTIQHTSKDPWPADINAWVKQYLKEMGVDKGKPIVQYVSERCTERAAAAFSQYVSS